VLYLRASVSSGSSEILISLFSQTLVRYSACFFSAPFQPSVRAEFNSSAVLFNRDFGSVSMEVMKAQAIVQEALPVSERSKSLLIRIIPILLQCSSQLTWDEWFSWLFSEVTSNPRLQEYESFVFLVVSSIENRGWAGILSLILLLLTENNSTPSLSVFLGSELSSSEAWGFDITLTNRYLPSPLRFVFINNLWGSVRLVSVSMRHTRVLS